MSSGTAKTERRGKRPKFRNGQVVCHSSGSYFRITDVIPCFDDTDEQRRPNRFLYYDRWTDYEERSLRALNAKERGA